MARYLGATTASTGNATSITVEPPHHSAGDLLVCMVAQDANSDLSTSSSGWTKQAETGPMNPTSGIFYNRASGSSEADLVVSSSTSGEFSAIMVNLGDTHATATFNAVSTPTSTSATFRDTDSVTTTEDNCYILEFAAVRELVGAHFEPDVTMLSSISDFPLGIAVAGYTQQSAGATPSHRVIYGTNSNLGNHTWTIAIRDDGNGNIEGQQDPTNSPATLLHPLFTSGEGSYVASGTTSDPTGLITSLDGATTGYNTMQGFSILTNVNHAATEHAGLGTFSADIGEPQVAETGLAAAQDLSDAIVSVVINSTSAEIPTYDTGGFYFGLKNAGTGAKVWKVAALDTRVTPALGTTSYVFDTTQASFADFGTPDLTSIDHVVIGGMALGTLTYTFAWAYLLNTMRLTGGSANYPCSFSNALVAAKSAGLFTVQGQLGKTQAQFYVNQDVQIGNGTDTTTWDSNNQAVEFPSAYDEGGLSVHANIPSAKLTLTVDASANDDIKLRNTTLNMGDFHNFAIAASTSASAVYDFAGTFVSNATVALNPVGSAISGLSFTLCKTITGNADLTGGCTISNSADDYAIVVTSQAEFENLQNCTFSGNNYSIQITGNHGGETWDGSGIRISGRTGTYDIQYTGTGTLTINADAGQSWAGEATVGTLTIAATPLTLTINSDTADTLIRYFANDSQTVADSATGTTLGYEYSTSDPVDIELVKQGYVPVNRQNVTPYDGNFDVVMDFDEAYNASHGLTITTEFDYNRSTKALTINSDQDALAVRSALADVIRTNSGYFNTPLLMVAIPGLTRVDLTDGMTITDMATWKGAGMERYAAADSSNPVEKWCHVKSVGSITGATVHYRQTGSGDSAAITLTNNVVDEALQYWRDDNHDGDTADTDEYDYSGHLLIKSFLAGAKQGRVDVLANAGISALQSNLYTVPLTNVAHDYAGTDPGISADLTLVAGGTVGGKSFSYKIVDGGTNTGEDIADQFNYNAAANPNAVIPGGTGLRYFELPDMVIRNANGVETERGYREGASPALVGFYVERGGSDHPDFTRFQADDGTYYTPAVTANISITGLVDASGAYNRLQIENTTAKAASVWQATTAYTEGDIVLRSTGLGLENTAGLYMRCTSAGTTGGSEPTWNTTVGNTTADGTATWTTYAVLMYDDDPAGTGYSTAYVDGEQFAAGESYTIRFAEMDGASTFKTAEATGIAAGSGFSVSMAVAADSVFAANGLNGFTYDSVFSPDFTNDYIVLDANTDFTAPQAYAYFCYLMTVSRGMYEFWGGVTAIDVGNYRINTSVLSLFFDESAGFVKQTDSARIYRDDDARPAIDPTTGGNGIEINWKNPVYVQNVGGSALLTDERTMLMTTLGGKIDTVDTVVDGIQTDLDNPTDGLGAIKAAVDGVGGGGDATEAKQDAIIAALDTVDGNVDSVKAKTDQLTFTNAGQVDSNAKSMNDTGIQGTGVEGDLWRG